MAYTTWEELEMSAYQAFRMTEAEHVANSYPTETDTSWVYRSANVEYEAFLMDAYDRGMVRNSTNY